MHCNYRRLYRTVLLRGNWASVCVLIYEISNDENKTAHESSAWCCDWSFVSTLFLSVMKCHRLVYEPCKLKVCFVDFECIFLNIFVVKSLKIMSLRAKKTNKN